VVQAEFAEERGKFQTEITKLRNKASLKTSDVKDRVYRPSLSNSSSDVTKQELSKAYQEGTKAANAQQQQAFSSYESRIQDLTAKVLTHIEI
jgi:Skp family chaperone for outer membrane proteins